jgi:hypothetical protein
VAVVKYTFTHTHTHSTQNRENGTIKKIGKCGPCPVFASFTLAFAFQLRKKHGKTSVRVVVKCPRYPGGSSAVHI